MNRVTVRFVPKSDTSYGPLSMADRSPGELAATIRPSRKWAKKSIRSFGDRAIHATETKLSRLSVELNPSEMTDMFGQVPMETHQTANDEKTSITLNESYRSPMQALEVPDSLKDSVEFAYIPRPVEFFAPLALPPHENIYHLRLDDVRMVLNAFRCHRQGWTGAGVKVAMADTGFMLHPYFLRSGSQLIPTESPGSGAADIDTSGHGTGEAANIFAVAPDCTVYGVKHGSSAASTLETCIGMNPDVMTNSWGYDIDHQSRESLKTNDPNMYFELLDIEAVIATGISSGICILFSAGNGHLAFPACHPDIISVGGVTVNEDGSLEASNYASAFQSQLYPGQDIPDFCGLVGRSAVPPQSAHVMLPVPPASRLDGMNFPSGNQGSGWGIFSGTSAACPQAAGVVALMKQIAGKLTPAQIRQVLAARSVDIQQGVTATGVTASPGPDLATGSGLIDALRSCGYLASGA